MDSITIKTKFGDQIKFVLLSEQDSLNFDVYIDKGKLLCNVFISIVN